MVRVIVVAHGQFAREIVASTQMIIGDNPELVAVDFSPTDSAEDLYRRCTETAGDARKVVFLVDMLGGTPYNVAARWCHDHPDSDVVTGLNLPMVIDASTRAKQNASVYHIVSAAMRAATTSVSALRTVVETHPGAPE